jgi:hypothetical protein
MHPVLFSILGTGALIAFTLKPDSPITSHWPIAFASICFGAGCRDLGIALRVTKLWSAQSVLIDWVKVEEFAEWICCAVNDVFCSVRICSIIRIDVLNSVANCGEVDSQRRRSHVCRIHFGIAGTSAGRHGSHFTCADITLFFRCLSDDQVRRIPEVGCNQECCCHSVTRFWPGISAFVYSCPSCAGNPSFTSVIVCGRRHHNLDVAP